ncbi:MAG: YjbQ family protein [Elusimicrobia bacterium]|nr:YjbQ family protein [Elusimicrobiota bacterium]
MAIYQETITFSTEGDTDILDITGQVADVVKKSGVTKGLATVFAVGSTAGITTIEHEPGVIRDLQAAAERWAPVRGQYSHNLRGENNGRSHILSSLIGTSFSVPINAGELILGTWQQIVFVDFDTRPRSRRVMVQVMGEKV